MSEHDPSGETVRKRARLPITPMQPYIEIPEPQIALSTKLRRALGGAAHTISHVYHGIVDPHDRRKRTPESTEMSD